MTRSATIIVVAFLVLVSVGAPVGGVVAGTAQSNGIDHQINFTVASGGNPNHQPGASGVDRYLYQENLGVDFEVLDFVTFVSPANMANNCTTTDARAAGIDRDNDDPGTYTDETLIGKYSEQVNSTNSRGQTITSFDFYEKGAFEGQHVALYKEDQGVLALDGCFTNPKEPGWYRGYAYFNGTGTDGNRKQIAGFSEWSYVCECESYDAAVKQLGEPPAEGPQGDTMPGRDDGPWYLAKTGSSSNSGGSGGGQTATATSGNTATATPGNGGGGPTATSGSGGSTTTATTVSGSSSTDTAGQRQGQSSGNTDGATATSAGTGTAPSTAGARNGSATTVTASSTHQPGLGVAAALAALALVLATLIGRRR